MVVIEPGVCKDGRHDSFTKRKPKHRDRPLLVQVVHSPKMSPAQDGSAYMWENIYSGTKGRSEYQLLKRIIGQSSCFMGWSNKQNSRSENKNKKTQLSLDPPEKNARSSRWPVIWGEQTLMAFSDANQFTQILEDKITPSVNTFGRRASFQRNDLDYIYIYMELSLKRPIIQHRYKT